MFYTESERSVFLRSLFLTVAYISSSLNQFESIDNIKNILKIIPFIIIIETFVGFKRNNYIDSWSKKTYESLSNSREKMLSFIRDFYKSQGLRNRALDSVVDAISCNNICLFKEYSRIKKFFHPRKETSSISVFIHSSLGCCLGATSLFACKLQYMTSYFYLVPIALMSLVIIFFEIFNKGIRNCINDLKANIVLFFLTSSLLYTFYSYKSHNIF